MRIQILCVLYKVRDFPAFLLILINERIVKTEFSGKTKTRLLACSIHKLFRANAGMAIDVLLFFFTIANRKMSGKIGQTLLQRIKVMNIGLLAVKYGNDVVKYLRVNVFNKRRIKFTQLI